MSSKFTSIHGVFIAILSTSLSLLSPNTGLFAQSTVISKPVASMKITSDSFNPATGTNIWISTLDADGKDISGTRPSLYIKRIDQDATAYSLLRSYGAGDGRLFNNISNAPGHCFIGKMKVEAIDIRSNELCFNRIAKSLTLVRETGTRNKLIASLRDSEGFPAAGDIVVIKQRQSKVGARKFIPKAVVSTSLSQLVGSTTVKVRGMLKGNCFYAKATNINDYVLGVKSLTSNILCVK